MSAAYWRSASQAAIHKALASLPLDATEKEKRAAISKAYPFGERAMYPYKIWLETVAKHFGTYKPSAGDAARRKRYRAAHPGSKSGGAEDRIANYEKATGKKFPGREA